MDWEFWEIKLRATSVWWEGGSRLKGKSGTTGCLARLVVFMLSSKVKMQEEVCWAGLLGPCGLPPGLLGHQCPHKQRPRTLAQTLDCEPLYWVLGDS